jgi:hypothetical protein
MKARIKSLFVALLAIMISGASVNASVQELEKTQTETTQTTKKEQRKAQRQQNKEDRALQKQQGKEEKALRKEQKTETELQDQENDVKITVGTETVEPEVEVTAIESEVVDIVNKELPVSDTVTDRKQMEAKSPDTQVDNKN